MGNGSQRAPRKDDIWDRDDESSDKPSVTESRKPTWEIPAVLVGYFSTLEQAIVFICRDVLGLKAEAVTRENRLVASAAYAIALVVLAGWSLVKLPRVRWRKDKDDAQSFKSVLRRARLIRGLRTLGLSTLRDLYLTARGVTIADSFNPGRSWRPRPEFYDTVDRYVLGDKTVEFQYPRSRTHVQVRTTAAGSDEFGTPQLLPWSRTPHRSLLLTTPHGIVWAIGYFISTVILRKKPPIMPVKDVT